jgi:hypothetical protein
VADTSGPRTQRLPGQPLFIDLGKHKKKRIKKLRTLEGRLMVRISDTLENMISEGQIKKDLQTIVVIVERRRRRSKLFGW